MSLFAERNYTRVMVFIDYRNIYDHLVPEMRNVARLDLYRLTQILVGNRELIGAYVFDGNEKISDPERDETLKMHNRLSENGFRVLSYELQQTEAGKIQKEVDVSLACEMLEHALMNHYDVAIVVSGDRDFFPAMKKVQAAGKRVEVAAFEDTQNENWKRVADMYYLLEKLPIMGLSSPDESMGVKLDG